MQAGLLRVLPGEGRPSGRRCARGAGRHAGHRARRTGISSAMMRGHDSAKISTIGCTSSRCRRSAPADRGHAAAHRLLPRDLRRARYEPRSPQRSRAALKRLWRHLARERAAARRTCCSTRGSCRIAPSWRARTSSSPTRRLGRCGARSTAAPRPAASARWRRGARERGPGSAVERPAPRRDVAGRAQGERAGESLSRSRAVTGTG